MSFNIWLQCYGDRQHTGIPGPSVRALFPIAEADSTPDRWLVRYDNQDSCEVYVRIPPAGGDRIQALSVQRPCSDMRFWHALLEILRLGLVVLYFPGSPPIIAGELSDPSQLPQNMVEALGLPMRVESAEELLRILKKR